jgi:hypothetical protein
MASVPFQACFDYNEFERCKLVGDEQGWTDQPLRPPNCVRMLDGLAAQRLRDPDLAG